MRLFIGLAVCLIVMTAFIACGEKQESDATEQQTMNEPKAVSAQPLSSKLEERRNRFREEAPAEVLAIMDKAQNEINSLNLPEKAIKRGDKLPAFNLPGTDGGMISSDDLLQQGPLVVVFYRGSWCPYCNLHLGALQEVLPQIEGLGGSLVAISPELPDSAITSVTEHELAYPVLSDTGLVYASACGLVFDVPMELDSLYQQFGIDVKGWNHSHDSRLPIPATYVVDTDGTIAFAHVDADYTHRSEPSEIVGTLNQLKNK